MVLPSGLCWQNHFLLFQHPSAENEYFGQMKSELTWRIKWGHAAVTTPAPVASAQYPRNCNGITAYSARGLRNPIIIGPVPVFLELAPALSDVWSVLFLSDSRSVDHDWMFLLLRNRLIIIKDNLFFTHRFL